MTEPTSPPIPESPMRFDAVKALTLLNDSYRGALLLFVEQYGRKPYGAEAKKLRRETAQKVLDQVTGTFSPVTATIVDREAVELLAGETLGGPFSETE